MKHGAAVENGDGAVAISNPVYDSQVSSNGGAQPAATSATATTSAGGDVQQTKASAPSIHLLDFGNGSADHTVTDRYGYKVIDRSK